MVHGNEEDFFITGKVVVITGAAREGGRLVLMDLPHTRPALEAQSGQLEASGTDRTVVFTADVRQEDVQAMVAYTLQTIGIVFRIQSV